MSTRSFGILSTAWAVALGLAVAGLAAAQVPDPPLNKNLDRYFVFAMKHSHLKDMRMTVRGCNVAVNCRRPSATSDCGVIVHDNPWYEDDSQIQGCVTRFTKPGGSIWQLFRDDTGSLANVTIRHPGIRPDGSNPCDAPVLGDVDGDGQPSCQTSGGQCMPDYGDLYTFCGFPVPFPACDIGRPVRADVQADCSAHDVVPGNQACDLEPGVYGTLDLLNGATLNLASPGAYVFCDVLAGRSVRIFGPGATIHVPESGEFKLNNATQVGTECGEIRVLKVGRGAVRFGRNSTINMRVCAPEADVQLGHANKLHGQFFGETVDADRNNEGGCCAGICSCFDTFDPHATVEGGVVTMESHCDLMPVTAVRVCGVPAEILSQTPNVLTFRVPAGTAGRACELQVVSPAGEFTHVDLLTVN